MFAAFHTDLVSLHEHPTVQGVITEFLRGGVTFVEFLLRMLEVPQVKAAVEALGGGTAAALVALLTGGVGAFAAPLAGAVGGAVSPAVAQAALSLAALGAKALVARVGGTPTT